MLVIWAGFEATRTVLPLPVFAVLAAPVAVIATALAIGQRDGLTLDRLLAAAWRQARSPRRMVTAPEGVPAVPDWVAPGLARQAGPAPAPVTPPWQLVTPDGVIGLGGDGAAARLRGVDGELRAAQPGRAGRADRRLRPVAALADRPGADPDPHRARGPGLGDQPAPRRRPVAAGPALEHAALGHAEFLAGLGATRQVLTRQVLLVTREAGRAAPGRPGSAAGRAAQRTAEAARLLASADLQARPLDGAQVTALLAAACDPGGPHRAQRLAPPGPLTRRGHAAQAAPLPAARPAPGRTGCPPRPLSRSPPGTSRSTGTAQPPWR